MLRCCILAPHWQGEIAPAQLSVDGQHIKLHSITCAIACRTPAARPPPWHCTLLHPFCVTQTATTPWLQRLRRRFGLPPGKSGATMRHRPLAQSTRRRSNLHGAPLQQNMCHAVQKQTSCRNVCAITSAYKANLQHSASHSLLCRLSAKAMEIAAHGAAMSADLRRLFASPTLRAPGSAQPNGAAPAQPSGPQKQIYAPPAVLLAAMSLPSALPDASSAARHSLLCNTLTLLLNASHDCAAAVRALAQPQVLQQLVDLLGLALHQLEGSLPADVDIDDGATTLAGGLACLLVNIVERSPPAARQVEVMVPAVAQALSRHSSQSRELLTPGLPECASQCLDHIAKAKQPATPGHPAEPHSSVHQADRVGAVAVVPITEPPARAEAQPAVPAPASEHKAAATPPLQGERAAGGKATGRRRAGRASPIKPAAAFCLQASDELAACAAFHSTALGTAPSSNRAPAVTQHDESCHAGSIEARFPCAAHSTPEALAHAAAAAGTEAAKPSPPASPASAHAACKPSPALRKATPHTSYRADALSQHASPSSRTSLIFAHHQQLKSVLHACVQQMDAYEPDSASFQGLLKGSHVRETRLAPGAGGAGAVQGTVTAAVSLLDADYQKANRCKHDCSNVDAEARQTADGHAGRNGDNGEGDGAADAAMLQEAAQLKKHAMLAHVRTVLCVLLGCLLMYSDRAAGLGPGALPAIKLAVRKAVRQQQGADGEFSDVQRALLAWSERLSGRGALVASSSEVCLHGLRSRLCRLACVA